MIQLEKEEKEPNQDELLRRLDRKEESVRITEKSQQASQEYLEFFSDISQHPTSKQTLIQKLRQAKIRYEWWKDASQYSIRIVKSICDNQIVTLQVSIGPFVLLLNLCNCSTKNYTHYLQAKTSTFATIYDYNLDQSKAIIKCTTFKPKDFLDTLIVVVKEYAFIKIAAVLEVGPQIMPIFGFDLLVFEDCIEFSMQKCDPLFGIDESIVKTLKEKLHILHQLNILHIDIKPQNFCHSPLFNQPIFIDFGLTQVIKQQLGELTDTAFMGSLNYCSPQMTKLYYQSNNGPVDLYMNDVICMKKSFKEMAQQRQKSQKVNFLKEKEDIDSEGSEEEIDAYPSITENKKIVINFVILRIKSFIFCEEDLSTWYEQYEHYLIRLKDSILSFIQNLSYSQYLQELSTRLLSYNKFDRFLCYSFINRLEKKGKLSKSSKSSSQLSEDHIEGPTSLATIRMNQIGQVLTIKSTYLSKKELQPQMNNNVFFDSPNIIAKAEKSLLFHKFMRFSDLRTVFTTNPKRLKVAKLLIAHLKLPEPSNGHITDYLCTCWRYILHLQLQSPSKHYHSNITIAFHNLMIIQGLSLEEYCQIFHKIGALEIQPILKCELIYTCSTSSVWQANRFYSKYDFYQFRTKYIQTVTFELNQLKNMIPVKLSEIVTFLVVGGSDFCDMSISFPYEQQLESIANLLSFEVYQDCRNNLKSSFIKQRYLTGRIVSVKELYQLINSLSKYRFDCYFFNLGKSCQQGGHASILMNIFNFIYKCWEGLDLFPQYKLYHNVVAYTERLTKTVNIEYYQKLLSKVIRVERIYDYYDTIYLLANFVRSKHNMTTQLLSIYDKLKQIFNHSFMLQLIHSDHPHHRMIYIYEIFSYCFIIYIELYQHQNGYSQQIDELIQQFSNRWSTEDDRIRGITAISVCMMIGTALQSINKHQASIEFQIHFATINYALITKTNLYNIVNNICRIIHDAKIPFTASHFDFLYSAIAHMNISKNILKEYILKQFPQLNFYLLVNRKDPTCFFDLHMNLWKEMQMDFKNEEMTAYFHQSYVFFLKYPQECSKLADRIKRLPLGIFKELERYNCACIIVLLLILEKKYDAVSHRILLTITQTLPRIQHYAHSAIKNILFSYLINREVSILSQNDTTFKAPFHDIVPQLMGYRTRKILHMARKVVKLTYVQYHQQRAYNNVLISNYDKNSSFCLLFDRYLRRPYQHYRF